MDQHRQEKHGGVISPAYVYASAGDFSGANSMQSFDPAPHDLIGLQAGMEMLGIPSKQPDAWREYFGKGIAAAAYPPAAENFMVVDDSSLRCLFPADGGQQQHNQRLSLSLYNHNPSGIQHQTFDGRFFPPPAAAEPPPMMYHHPHQQLRSSKYLSPAQGLLNEFCCLRGGAGGTPKHKKSSKWEEGRSSSSSSWNQALYSMDLLELQTRKSRLLAMLEEVDRRYRKYCDQMKAVVSAFEAVAGEGAAMVYSSLASKAMSRHFRCLRDGIVGQIQETKKAMGEKDPAVPGSTRGETPRLRLLDQCLRQQKQFQQGGMVENHPWRPQRGLPERSVSVLRAWLFEHFLHPYPSDVDKHILSRQTGLSRSQVSNWFINARVRLWKPMVEEMYTEETKEQDNQAPSNGTPEDSNNNNTNASSSSRHSQLHPNENPNPNPSSSHLQDDEDRKPQLLTDSDSLASIINSGHHMHGKNPQYQQQQQQQLSRAENFGVVDMDFASFGNQSFGGGSSGVSLTLGLQQHDGGGMSLSFSPAAQQSIFFSRESMDDCQPVQFSISDGDQTQSVPYRNLMGALHDLTG